MSRTPASLSIPVVRGSTWEDAVDYTDAAGAPIDLTGYEARMQVWDEDSGYDLAATPLMELLTTGATPRLFIETPPGGTVPSRVRVHVEAADTVVLNPDNERKIKRLYGIELFKPAGVGPEYVVPFLKGKIPVYGELVR